MDQERRNETRADVNIDIQVNTIMVGEKFIKLKKPILMKLTNLSCNGACLTSYLNIPTDIQLLINLEIGTKKFNIIADIMRKDQDGDQFYYGCNFKQLAENEYIKIRKYVFEQQIKNKRRKNY